jgi:pimeloyl-ACP methyl ester carboxylesterase
MPDLLVARAGDFSSVSYTLSDMAADTIGLMDALDFERTHFMSASMGGMIAQTIATEYLARVRSLTSMIYTTGNPFVGQPDYMPLAHLGIPPRDDRQGLLTGRLDPLMRLDRRNIHSTKQQWRVPAVPVIVTMIRSVWYARLWQFSNPATVHSIFVSYTGRLVIHETANKMIDISGGQATAAAIPGAELVIFDGMGHGFPKLSWPKCATRIANLVH